jgi:heat shock protein HslJ
MSRTVWTISAGDMAKYRVGAQLAVNPPTATNMLCGTPEGIMEQEMAFLALLPAIGSYATEGDSLYLKDASGTVVAELAAY